MARGASTAGCGYLTRVARWAFSDRREALAVVSSLGFVVGLSVLCSVAPGRVVPSIIVLISPLVACTAARPRWTAVVGVTAIVSGSLLISGGELGLAAVIARLTILAVVALFAVWLADERVRREGALAESAARGQFVDLAETSADLIGMFSADGSIRYLNPSGLAMLGLSSLDELEHIEPLDVVPREFHDLLGTVAEALEQSGQWLGEIQFRRLDDRSLVDVEMLAFEMASDPQAALAVVCRDISDRKQSAAALEMSELRYRTLVEATSAVTWTTDPDGRFVEPQPSWSAFTGQADRTYEGFGWSDAMHPDDLDMVWARWRTSVESRSFYAAEPRLWHAPSATFRRVLITGAPVLDDDGGLRSWFGAVLDIDDRRRAEERAAEAAHRLNLVMQTAPVGIAFFGPDLRYLVLNERFAELDGVPRDDHIGCSITDVTPSAAPWLYPLILKVFDSGLPLVDIEVDAVLDDDGTPPDIWLLNVVPVEDVSGDRVGVGLTVIDVTDRHRRERDLRAAFEERDHIARALQNALLPPDLPVLEGIDVTARYLPAGAGAEVGGDFYDVIEDGAGRWHVVIGDVCGKGPDAAALTGLARHTLRAAAIGRGEPVELLTLVNEALRREDTDRFLTLVDLMLDLSGDAPKVTTVLAGHPPPLLLRDGEVHEMGSYGALLGVFDEVSLVPTIGFLEPGDIVIAYTDGLIEHQGPTTFGEPELRALLASCAGLDGEATSERITNRVVELRSSESSEDDVAFLVLAVPRVAVDPHAGSRDADAPDADTQGVAARPAGLRVARDVVCRAEFPAETSSPGRARSFLRRVLDDWSCADDVGVVEVAQLLVSELVGNTVQHASGPAVVTATLGRDRIRVSVADREPSPPVARRGGPLAPNGRGLLILDELAADWGITEVMGPPGKAVWFEIDRPAADGS